MLRKIEEDFGISLIQEEEGKCLEFDLEYPNEETVMLDMVYELYRMANMADKDVGKIKNFTKTDLDFLMQEFDRFIRRFGKYRSEMEFSATVRNLMENTGRENSKEVVELFSMHCKALAGRLLLEEKGLKL